jgi:hypothetical protein
MKISEKAASFVGWRKSVLLEGLSPDISSAIRRAIDLNGFSPASEIYMYEDLSEIYQAALEDERKRKYMKEIGDWLVEEYFEPYQAS